MTMNTEIFESAQQVLSFGQFIHKLNQKHKILVRKREKCLNKLTRLKMSVVFNETCLNEGLLPTYTNVIIK